MGVWEFWPYVLLVLALTANETADASESASDDQTTTSTTLATDRNNDQLPTAGQLAAANAFPMQEPPEAMNDQSGQPQPIDPGMLTFQFKPETKDELFARIDADNDQAVNMDDYMKRDRYYVESVKNEFNEIDANQDQKVTKQEFDDYIKKLEEQRKQSLLSSSNFTLQRHDTNKDGELSESELGHYISDTLQRNISQLPAVFKEFDKDGNTRLNLEEFSNLDFHFPWDKFPLNENAYRQVFFGAGPAAAAVPPPPISPEMAGSILPGSPAGFQLPQPPPQARYF
ncbi:EF-hand domain pair domain-containing protein [Ditylenchus destructor]|nr:EF-hand domain pair domain-containing protein [Ditylenchus destructor]